MPWREPWRERARVLDGDVPVFCDWDHACDKEAGCASCPSLAPACKQPRLYTMPPSVSFVDVSDTRERTGGEEENTRRAYCRPVDTPRVVVARVEFFEKRALETNLNAVVELLKVLRLLK